MSVELSNLPETVINVGIISFGLSGRIFHAPFLLTNPKFNLVAVYERTKSESQDFAVKHNLNIDLVRSVEELVNRTDIQLVVVCSPIEFHYEHAKAALAAGKHVLVEKAFCSTAAQAKELMFLAVERELVCIPYQNRRYDADFLTLKKVVGKLGKIAEYNGFYNRYNPIVKQGHWKDHAVGSGGNFLSLGSHMIDQAVVLFGAPARVFGDIRTQRDGGVLDDAWEVHLYYNDASSGTAPDEHGLHTGGFRAILKGSLLCKDHGLRYMVHGDHGSWLKVGVDSQEAFLMTGGLPVYPPVVPSAGDLLLEYPIEPDTEAAVTYGSEPRHQWGVLTTVSPQAPADSHTVLTPPVHGSYHLLYDELYGRIVHGVQPSVDPGVAVTVLRIIELAKQSSREGRVLDYSLD